jgi:DNA-binding PadR family transcriptional regulator
MTNAELAILSLVAEQPRHGYDIEQLIEARGMREWTDIGFSSIYYILKKLEREGLVEAALDASGRGPARKVYNITRQGVEAMHAALLEVLSVPQRASSPIMMGIANLPAVSRSEALEALRQYHGELAARLEHMQTRWEAQKPLPYFVDALFDYSEQMIQTELAWIAGFIEQLERQN